jgi:flagellar export protein FliJ
MSLTTLQTLSARTQEALTLELARVTDDVIAMEARCRSLEQAVGQEAERYCREVEQGLSIEEALERQGRMEAQHTMLSAARQNLAALKDAWDAAHTRLLAARVERQVLDRLAERREAEQRAEQGRREQRSLDEAAQRRPTMRGDRPS